MDVIKWYSITALNSTTESTLSSSSEYCCLVVDDIIKYKK